jgi:hypothetical protein
MGRSLQCPSPSGNEVDRGESIRWRQIEAGQRPYGAYKWLDRHLDTERLVQVHVAPPVLSPLARQNPGSWPYSFQGYSRRILARARLPLDIEPDYCPVHRLEGSWFCLGEQVQWHSQIPELSEYLSWRVAFPGSGRSESAGLERGGLVGTRCLPGCGLPGVRWFLPRWDLVEASDTVIALATRYCGRTATGATRRGS